MASTAVTTTAIELQPQHHISGLGANLDQLSGEQRSALEALKAAVAGQPPVDANSDCLDDAAYVRFLIARQWDLVKAEKMLLDAMKWRLKRPAQRWFVGGAHKDAERERRFRFCNETGKIRVPGVDRHGRALMVFDNSKENTDDPTNMIEFLAWNMQLCYRTMQGRADKIMLVIHLKHNSILNQPSLAVTRETIQILSGVFPESLGTCVLLDAPKMFSSFFNAIKGFIDPVTRSKVYFLSGDYAQGSSNDRIMCDLVGPNWKVLTGVEQPVLSTGHYSDFLRRTIDASPGFRLDDYWPTVLTREEAACADIGQSKCLKVAGEVVQEFNGPQFLKLRQFFGVADDFLRHFDFNFAAGGGKGGSLMAFTADNRFIVKEMSGDDHQSLLKITDDYVEHVTTGPSLLCHLLGHFKHTSFKTPFVVMANCLAFDGEWAGMYDLKGTADDKTIMINGSKVKDVHKRFYHLHMWGHQGAWSADRKAYYQGKQHAASTTFPVTPTAFASLRRSTRRDCAFLAGHGLMDYSLILGVRILALHDAVTEGFVKHDLPGNQVDQTQQAVEEVRVGAPFACVSDQEVVVYHLGVIDFLQPWNAAKVVANKIKFLETNKSTVRPAPYAARFTRFVGEKFVPDGFDLTGDAAQQLALSLIDKEQGEAEEQTPGRLDKWTRTLSVRGKGIDPSNSPTHSAQGYSQLLADPKTRQQYEHWATSCTPEQIASQSSSRQLGGSFGAAPAKKQRSQVVDRLRRALVDTELAPLVVVVWCFRAVLAWPGLDQACLAATAWTRCQWLRPLLPFIALHVAAQIVAAIAHSPRSNRTKEEQRLVEHRVERLLEALQLVELGCVGATLALHADVMDVRSLLFGADYQTADVAFAFRLWATAVGTARQVLQLFAASVAGVCLTPLLVSQGHS